MRFDERSGNPPTTLTDPTSFCDPPPHASKSKTDRKVEQSLDLRAEAFIQTAVSGRGGLSERRTFRPHAKVSRTNSLLDGGQLEL